MILRRYMRLIPCLLDRFQGFIPSCGIEIHVRRANFHLAHARIRDVLERFTNSRHARLAMHSRDFDSHTTILDAMERAGVATTAPRQ